MDKKKILSSLALAGILTAGVLGANVNAAVANEYIKPVGVYKRLVPGKTVVPYVLKDKNTLITIKDLKEEFKNLQSVGGDTRLDDNKVVKTGDTFIANDITYTAVIYGDVNKDGKISTADARMIQRIVLKRANNIDNIQVEAADVRNDGKISTGDALAVQKYVLGSKTVIDKLPPAEDSTAPILKGITNGEHKYINLNSEYQLPEVTAIDEMDGNVEVKVTVNGVENGTIDTTTQGDYTVTYKAVDRTGNTATATIIVTVDGNVPVLYIVENGEEKIAENKTIYVKQNSEFNLSNDIKIVAKDTVDNEVEVIKSIKKIVGEQKEDTDTIDISAEGEYEVTYTAKDSMNNITTAIIKIVVDGKSPKADVRYSTTNITKEGVNVTIESDEEITVPEGWKLSEDKKSATHLYTDNVTDERVVISDLAGNKTEAVININNIDNKVEANVTYNPDENTLTKGKVKATITSDEKLQEVEGWTLASDKKSMTKDYDTNIIENVIVKDFLENEKIIEINIQNIDKTAPKAEVQFDVTTMTKGDVVVTLIANEKLSSVSGTQSWSLVSDDATKATATFTANGNDEVTITDIAGNTSKVNVNVSNIDKIGPNASVDYDIKVSTNQKVTATITADEKMQKVDEWTLSEDGLSMSKQYEENVFEKVDIYDLVGNKSTVDIAITNIDTEAPKVQGFTEGKTSYNTVEPIFTEGIATLKKGDAEPTRFTSGTTIGNANGVDDGSYILEVRDAAGNVTTVKFTIDNQAPVFEILNPVTLKKGDNYDTTVVATDAIDGEISLLPSKIEYNDGTNPVQEVESIVTTGEKDGTYTLTYTAEDKAGNQSTTTKTVTVDATSASVVSLISSNPNSAKEVTMRVEFNEKMQAIDGWVEEDNQMKSFTRKYTANASETFEFKDVAGNITRVDISINNIDSDAPSAGVSYSTKEPTNGNVTVTITASEELQQPNASGWTLAENKKSMSKEYTSNQTETVTIKDLAGNSYDVKVEVNNIDKTPITATPSYTPDLSTITNGNVIVKITSDKELKTLDGWTLSDDKKILSKEYKTNTTGTETITITDLAGNTADISVTVTNIDKQAPIIKGFTEGVKSYKALTLSTDDTDIKSVELLKDGVKVDSYTTTLGAITSDGNYQLTVTDNAGNITKILFNIDNVDPVITGVEEGKYYNSATPIFTEGVAELNVLDATDNTTVLSTNSYTSGTPIVKDGNYQLVVTDAAGNSSSIKFIIDTTGPKITKIQEGNTYRKPVKPVITTNGIISKATLTRNGTEIEYIVNKTTISEDGEYVLTVEDNLGKNSVHFYIDKTGPAIEGVEEGKYYKEVTPVFTETKATLKKDGGKAKTFTSGTKITADGNYTLKVIDGAENITTINFFIKTSAPLIQNVVNGKTYTTNVTPTTTDTAVESVELLKNGTKVESYTATELVSGTPISGDGEYTLTVIDKAGNSTEPIQFTIDTVVKDVEVITSNNGQPTNESVLVTIKAGEKLQAIPGWTISSDQMTVTKLYDADVTENITVTDLAGNATSVEIKVENIDKTAPTVTTGPISDVTAATKNPVTVTIVANESIRPVEGWTLADDKKTLTKQFTENTRGEGETVELIDLAGNKIETPLKVTVDNIYHKEPTIIGMYKEKEIERKVSEETLTLPNVTATDVKGNAVSVQVKVEKEYNGVKTVLDDPTKISLSSIATYTITYTAEDAAGNIATIVRIINVTA